MMTDFLLPGWGVTAEKAVAVPSENRHNRTSIASIVCPQTVIDSSKY